MPMSEYMRALRDKVGHDLLVVPSVTGLVFDASGGVLLVKHSNGGVWVAPGGGIDPGESPTDAVVREVWEETGLVVEPVALAGVFSGPQTQVRYRNGDLTEYVMTVFECEQRGGELRADGDEVHEARFVALAELDEIGLSPWARTLLPQLLASRGRPLIHPPRWRPPGAR